VGRFTEHISGDNYDDDNNGETEKEEPLPLASNLIGDDEIELEDNDWNELSDEEKYDQYTSQSCKESLSKVSNHLHLINNLNAY
jgi:hypothetical protein